MCFSFFQTSTKEKQFSFTKLKKQLSPYDFKSISKKNMFNVLDELPQDVPLQVANSFQSGKFVKVEGQVMKLYRLYNGEEASKIGDYWSLDKYPNAQLSKKARIDLAILEIWNNPLSKTFEVETTIEVAYVGFVGAQSQDGFFSPGGGLQVFIPEKVKKRLQEDDKELQIQRKLSLERWRKQKKKEEKKARWLEEEKKHMRFLEEEQKKLDNFNEYFDQSYCLDGNMVKANKVSKLAKLVQENSYCAFHPEWEVTLPGDYYTFIIINQREVRCPRCGELFFTFPEKLSSSLLEEIAKPSLNEKLEMDRFDRMVLSPRSC